MFGKGFGVLDGLEVRSPRSGSISRFAQSAERLGARLGLIGGLGCQWPALGVAMRPGLRTPAGPFILSP